MNKHSNKIQVFLHSYNIVLNKYIADDNITTICTLYAYDMFVDWIKMI